MKRFWTLSLLAVLVVGVSLTASAGTPSGVEVVGDDTTEVAIPSGYPAGSVLQPLLWDNGPMITCADCGFDGNPASELQTALGMNTYGFGHQYAYQYRVADDFAVPEGCTWSLEAIQYYGYQTGTYGYPPVSTMTGYYYQMWDGVPGGEENLLCGGFLDNRMTATNWSGIYRVLDTTPTNTQRPIMESTVSIAPGCEVLDPGTYWLDWSADGTLGSGPWANPITIPGQTTTGNALQTVDGGATWADAMDTGTATQQGMPFKIFGTEICDLGTLQGHVYNTCTGIPLAGVEVTASPGSHMVVTDANGYYEMYLPAGTYDVTATTPPGCAGKAAIGVVVLANGTTVQDFDLICSDLWFEQLPADKPSARGTPAMAYDCFRKETVLFGGQVDTYVRVNDTWVWNGHDWQQKKPATKPPVLSGHAMVYDSERQVTVLFGGYQSYHPSGENDTYTWNGYDWKKQYPGTKPPARWSHAMAYDSGQGVTVLFGGGTFDDFFDDTWVWDGTNWSLVDPAPDPKPTARWGHKMAYDSARGVTVLFGGYDGTDYLDDTWELRWDGTSWTWTEVVPPPVPRPSPRWWPAMAYDSARGVTVLFGGYDGTSYLDDTWEWDGADWFLITPPGPKPSPRVGPAMAYHANRGVMVLFGGGADSGRKDDTWEYPLCEKPPCLLHANTFQMGYFSWPPSGCGPSGVAVWGMIPVVDQFDTPMPGASVKASWRPICWGPTMPATTVKADLNGFGWFSFVDSHHPGCYYQLCLKNLAFPGCTYDTAQNFCVLYQVP